MTQRLRDVEEPFPTDDSLAQDDVGPVRTAISAGAVVSSDEGPCLYLGPAGQRCYRRAVNGGFCPAHQPGATVRENAGKRTKLLAAIVGIFGALWPYIYDFARELIRLLHPR